MYGDGVTAAGNPDDEQPEPGPLTGGAEESVGGAATGRGHDPAPDSGEQRGRPASLAPRELGFTRREPVPWLNPVLLAGTAVRVVLAELFGAYLDKRELQSGLPGGCHDEAGAGE